MTQETNWRTYEASVAAWAAAGLERLMTYVTGNVVCGASVNPELAPLTSAPVMPTGTTVFARQNFAIGATVCFLRRCCRARGQIAAGIPCSIA